MNATQIALALDARNESLGLVADYTKQLDDKMRRCVVADYESSDTGIREFFRTEEGALYFSRGGTKSLRRRAMKIEARVCRDKFNKFIAQLHERYETLGLSA
jgi:hypothetical protein